jgi:hypothetical protein
MTRKMKRDSALELFDSLKPIVPVYAVGIGGTSKHPTFIVYVNAKSEKSTVIDHVPSEFHGLPVTVVKTSEVKPLRHRPRSHIGAAVATNR